MRPVISRAVLVGLLALGSFACEERPARPSAPSVSGNPISLEIRGNTRLYRPGETTQLTTVAVYAGGLKTDATTLRPSFIIPVSSNVANVNSSGLVRATGYGRVTVQVACAQQSVSTQITVVPEGMFLVSGQVVQGSVRAPVFQAKVQVATLGETFTTMTDANGRYSLPAVGAVTLHVEAANFSPQSFPLTVYADTQLDLTLSRSTDVFEGVYGLTFTASPSCSFPANVATRQYIATVYNDAPYVAVLLSGANFDTSAWSAAGFSGTATGNDVRFTIVSWDYYYDLTFRENLGNGQYLSFDGVATGTVGSSSLVTTSFNGTVAWTSPSGNVPCAASDHRLVFKR